MAGSRVCACAIVKSRRKAVISNANLLDTVQRLVGTEQFDRQFVEQANAVRLNNSSTQVYMALKPDDVLDESTGDLLFSSVAPAFQTDLLLSRAHHEPHVFVLLSAHASPGSAALPDCVQHQRAVRRLGRVVGGGI